MAFLNCHGCVMPGTVCRCRSCVQYVPRVQAPGPDKSSFEDAMEATFRNFRPGLKRLALTEAQERCVEIEKELERTTSRLKAVEKRLDRIVGIAEGRE